jgi:glycosyltransferase involved in cell wall biosynthesis
MKAETNRLKIAYFSFNDPLDKRSWSGTTYYLGQTLQRNIGDVDFLGPVKVPWLLDKFLRGVAKATRLIFGTEYLTKYSILLNLYGTRVLKRRMKGKRYDFLIAPASAPQLGALNTKLPVVYFGDSTYKCYRAFYDKEFKDLNRFSQWEGNYMEQRALDRSHLVIMSSQWAAESAIKDYGVSPSIIEVLPLGANMDFTPEASMIFNKEEHKTLTLLFLAVDWDRKGGKIAFETLKHLQSMGVRAKLIVCGCIPPPEFSDADMEVIPFLNKNIKEDHDRFVRLLSTVHFLILPTRADCSLLVACESNSYGVPAITTNAGGVSDIVKNGINGYCLPLEARGPEYAKLIAEIYADKERYHQLIRTSRQRYEEELNWDKWAEHFLDIYNRHFGKVRKLVIKDKAEAIPE